MTTAINPTEPRRRTPRSVFFLLFTVSGFAGLIYESIWSHYLKLFLGHAAYAQTLVLALFMGGMAVGSWICSRYSARWINLLRGYAITEGIIGLAALLFHGAFITVTSAAYEHLLPGLHDATGSDLLTALLKWSLSALLILPQSILLGMTFPLMSAGIIRRHPDAPGETLAMLYFTNSVGAAIGVLASGFLLVDHFGLPGTIQAAGVINLILAAVVWGLARRPDHAGSPERESLPLPGSESPFGLFLGIAAFTGAASFVYEIGWIRMLSLVLGASTHSFELMLSSFILGLACGGLWIRKRIDRIKHPVRFLALVQVAMGLLALATLPLYGQMFPLMQMLIKGLAKTDSGYLMFLLSGHGIALAIMFPATFCAGMTLPLITYVLLRGGHGERAIGAVYSANTFGSIIGVFAAAHIGMPALGLKGLITAGAVIDVLLGIVLLWRLAGGYRRDTEAGDVPSRSLPAWVTAGTVAAFALVLWTVQLDAYRMASGVFRRGDLYTERDAKLIYYRDGKTTSVSMMDFGEDRSLRTNGKSDGAIAMRGGPIVSDEITMTLTGALPLAYRPDAKQVAVIGVGTGLTTHTLLDHAGLERVDTIEIEPGMAEASRNFAPINSNAFADPRSNIVFDDAKTYFSTNNRHYDLIISEPSNPWVSGVSSLFTSEFYRLARRHLKPGGVMLQWFQLYEIDVSLLASVLRALGEVFPDYAIYSSTNGDLLIVAGDEAALKKPLTDITAIPGLSKELARVHIHNRGDLEIRRIGSRRVLAPFFASYGVPANSDFHPYLDMHAARYRFLQQSAGEFTSIGNIGVPVVVMLEGRDGLFTTDPSLDGEDYFDRIELIRKARYARDFLMRPIPPEPAAIPRNLQKDLDIIRLRLLECREPQRYDIWFHSLYQIARTVNPLLTVDEGRSLWAHIGRSRCIGTLDAAQRRWIDLFAAVGTHDARRMVELSEVLLQERSDLPGGHRQYLITAGMTGHLVMGSRAGAGALWNRYADEVKGTTDLTLRLLYAHAFDKR